MQIGVGESRPGIIQVWLFKNMNGHPLAIYVWSKKLVEFPAVLLLLFFICFDYLSINVSVFRKVNLSVQKEKASLLLLLSGRIFCR